MLPSPEPPPVRSAFGEFFKAAPVDLWAATAGKTAVDGLWTAQKDAPPTNPPTAPACRPQGPQAITTRERKRQQKKQSNEAGTPKTARQRAAWPSTAPPPVPSGLLSDIRLHA